MLLLFTTHVLFGSDYNDYEALQVLVRLLVKLTLALCRNRCCCCQTVLV